MTEKLMWKLIRSKWRGHGQRIEASRGEVEEGTPDSVLSVDGRGAYVELKVWPEPLRPLQLPWAIDARQRGAAVWLLCHLHKREFWLGTHDEYGILQSRKNKPTGSSLQFCLDRIESRLNSHPVERKQMS